jgi:hypothetical protein
MTDLTRQVLVEALTAQAERYRASARNLHHVAERKMAPALEAQAEDFCALAEHADHIRDQIRDGGPWARE